jgi:predicted secreted Zn-dependent protease
MAKSTYKKLVKRYGKKLTDVTVRNAPQCKGIVFVVPKELMDYAKKLAAKK